MSYQFHYQYANDTWHVAYQPFTVTGDPEPYYELPGEIPEGSFSLYATVASISDGGAAGLVVKADDGQLIGLLGAWNFSREFWSDDTSIFYVHRDATHPIDLRIDYDAEGAQCHLWVSTTGVWQAVATVPVSS